MHPFKAQVRNGRLILDEPTDLPEGDVVELVPVDPSDELDDGERTRLDAAIHASVDQIRARTTIDATVVLAKLRAHR